MATSVNNELLTRPDTTSGRVISSSKLPDEVKGTTRVRRSHRQIRTENVFRRTLTIVGLVMVVLVLGIMITLVVQSMPSIRSLGAAYLWGKTWDPVKDVYGALPFLIGTILTSFLALAISIPFSFSVAIFLGEYYPKGWFSDHPLG